MCGRYYVDEETNQELLDIVRNLDKRLQGEAKKAGPTGQEKGSDKKPTRIKTGEIFPSNTVPIFYRNQTECDYEAMTWGFLGKGSSMIINARGETAHQKPMFSESLLNRRIVIPASGFFEWDHTEKKQKFYFTSQKDSLLYMAGMYRYYDGAPRFVILTTAANDSMIAIHNRMPILMERSEVVPYLNSETDARSIIRRIPEMLDKRHAQEVFQEPKPDEESFSQMTLPL